MHHYRMPSAEARAVLTEVAGASGFAVVQCGLLQVKVRDLLGLPRPVDLSFANPLDLIPAANAFPRVPFVIPHLGAGFLRETLMAGAQCENVLVDTSSSNSWLSTQTPPLDLAGRFAPRSPSSAPSASSSGPTPRPSPAGGGGYRRPAGRGIPVDRRLGRRPREGVRRERATTLG